MTAYVDALQPDIKHKYIGVIWLKCLLYRNSEAVILKGGKKLKPNGMVLSKIFGVQCLIRR